jgi:predicted small lipoprotein YifL
MKRFLLSLVLLSTVVVLTGCNGTVGSVSFPAEAPWQDLTTAVLSPTDDLVAVSTGAGLESELILGSTRDGTQAIVECRPSGNSNSYIQVCNDRACDAAAVCGEDRAIEKRYVYSIVSHFDREVFTAGSVQIQDGNGATLMGLAINVAGGSLDVAAGYSEGLVPGFQNSFIDELGGLYLTPHWPGFAFGLITGQVCSEGVCQTTTIAECGTDNTLDLLTYLTPAEPGTYSGTCGTVPLNLTINPAYASVGACISQRKATCDGLTGQARKTCNHAQIGVCHATFNVPSVQAN